MVTPGGAAICPGRVRHHRERPVEHDFEQPVSMVWFDPDEPGELLDRHPLWSTRWGSPVRFRPDDYGTAQAPFGAESVRRELAAALGSRPEGPVRVLTQIRRWGWLFNPITLYLAWGDPVQAPVGAVAEVTNTPWKERHRYPVALRRSGDRLTASFAKELHVSPFLGMDFRYELTVDGVDDELAVGLDVVDDDGPILRTLLEVERSVPSRRRLGRSLVSEPLPTHRVSAAIHAQAARLFAKGVPFVAHPRRNGDRDVSVEPPAAEPRRGAA